MTTANPTGGDVQFPQTAGAKAVELGLRLSAATLLLHPVGPFPIRPAILACAAAVLVLPGQLRNPWLWGGLAVLTGVRPILDWPLADNHAYLLAYWCTALALTCKLADRDAGVRRSARLLIGLTFLFATLWKAFLSPDFVSGDFMRFAWITDPRLAGAASYLGGLDAAALEANRAFLAGALDSPEALHGGEGFVWAARLASFWTLLLEGTVALSFLWWRSPRMRALGHVALLIFCLSTYVFVTVEGFGWLLLSMGVVVAEPGWWQRAYLVAFGVVLCLAFAP